MLYVHGPVAAVVAAATLAVPQPSAADQQAMFDAVKQLLANVPRQDQPQKVIGVEPSGPNQYRVHVQMVQGDGWFLLKWNGTKWEASGLNR